MSISSAVRAVSGENPDRGGDPRPSPSRSRPIDLVHLAKQTLGDRDLEREVLALLEGQIGTFIERLEQAGLEEQRQIAHAIRGAARNVGAFNLATVAELVEDGLAGEDALQIFRIELHRTRAFIRALHDA